MTCAGAYKVADPAVIPDLINAIQSVNTSCAKPDGSEYILSVKGGKQMSPEGLDLGVQLVFVLEFKASIISLPIPVVIF